MNGFFLNEKIVKDYFHTANVEKSCFYIFIKIFLCKSSHYSRVIQSIFSRCISLKNFSYYIKLYSK